MDEAIRKQLVPGTNVVVTQQIAMRKTSLNSETEGTIVDFQQRPTGSWFAHSKGDKLWLDRLVLRKPDGEITTLNLDEYSHLEILGKAQGYTAPTKVAETGSGMK